MSNVEIDAFEPPPQKPLSGTIRPQPHLLTPLGSQIPLIAQRVTVHAWRDPHPPFLAGSRKPPLDARIPGISTRRGTVASTAGAIGFVTDDGAGGRGTAEVLAGVGVADAACSGRVAALGFGDGRSDDEEGEGGEEGEFE